MLGLGASVVVAGMARSWWRLISVKYKILNIQAMNYLPPWFWRSGETDKFQQRWDWCWKSVLPPIPTPQERNQQKREPYHTLTQVSEGLKTIGIQYFIVLDHIGGEFSLAGWELSKSQTKSRKRLEAGRSWKCVGLLTYNVLHCTPYTYRTSA
jgi:hypothetical protein